MCIMLRASERYRLVSSQSELERWGAVGRRIDEYFHILSINFYFITLFGCCCCCRRNWFALNSGRFQRTDYWAGPSAAPHSFCSNEMKWKKRINNVQIRRNKRNSISLTFTWNFNRIDCAIGINFVVVIWLWIKP